ncbi:hypothetical protein [Actinomadura sp. WAC 06369]|uniref:hypothetical protein n=1 Tax=Actinomadura sp. WAC 06369 TaxID=2203193 RepID=UPI000F7AA0D3|nr:hypothetical protein [Actinomadura sp. WAC 06369]
MGYKEDARLSPSRRQSDAARAADEPGSLERISEGFGRIGSKVGHARLLGNLHGHAERLFGLLRKCRVQVLQALDPCFGGEVRSKHQR